MGNNWDLCPSEDPGRQLSGVGGRIQIPVSTTLGQILPHFLTKSRTLIWNSIVINMYFICTEHSLLSSYKVSI